MGKNKTIIALKGEMIVAAALGVVFAPSKGNTRTCSLNECFRIADNELLPKKDCNDLEYA